MTKTMAAIKRDSKRWDALMNSGRIRILGTAGIGNKDYQHFGMEIWSTYQYFENKERCNNYGKETLVTYVDTIIQGESDVKSN